MKLKLVDKINTEANTVSFFFKPEEDLNFKPGQFLHYFIANPHPDDRGENRFFSVASAPFEGLIRLTTKFSPDGSGFKQDLRKLQIGDSIKASIPKGSFSLNDTKGEYVFIAGGMGITPFRSILLDLDHRNIPLNIKLLYANKTHDALFKDELETLAAKHPEFKIYYIISEGQVTKQKLTENITLLPGKVDKTLIQSLIPNLKSPVYYISGPESMVETLEQVVWDMGIPKEQTKRDYYPGYANY